MGRRPQEEYPGEHTLFYRSSTARHFPSILSVPQRELAALFNVPIVNKEDTKARELQYHDLYDDRMYSFRNVTLPEGRPPFVPPSTAGAKNAIERPHTSVFCSTEEEFVTAGKIPRAEKEKALTPTKCNSNEKDGQPAVPLPPFRYGMRMDASEAIRKDYYLNSMDSEALRVVKEATMNRVKENRERLSREGYTNAVTPQQTRAARTK